MRARPGRGKRGLLSVTASACSAAAIAAVASCGGKPPAAAKVAAPAASASASAAASASPSAAASAGAAPAKPKLTTSAGGVIYQITPSRLLPDLAGNRGVVSTEDGQRRILVDRMRLVAREDGSLERATELLPLGSVTSIKLPTRLGGGYLFHVNGGGGTQVWRAAGWLDKLRPLTQIGSVVSDIVPGFDRLYVRFNSGNRLAAINASTGESMPLGPLPVSSAYGNLVFADGWRGVVETDLRGPLATFDAGMTWRPVGLSERAQAITLLGGNPAITVAGGGRYVIDERGAVTFRADAREAPGRADAPPQPQVRPPGPLGKRPLRAAVEDGWPDTETTAIVARAGALARVSLRDGSIAAIAEEAYPDKQSACHAARLGLRGIGFICGEREGPTTVYEYAPPLAMKPLLRFSKPRYVAASGNGALVIRGPCDDAPPAASDARTYCVRSPAGVTREVQVKGDIGVERVVGLGDGRVAVVVPPRGGSAGTLTILGTTSATSVGLRLPAEPRSVVRELKRGMWLDGFEERAPGVIGGWIEAGGPLVGIEITLDGKVKAGEVRDDSGGAVLGGRLALSLMEGGRAAETTDGGMTWTAFDLPDRDDESRSGATRACGPAGCALGGWIRVGWGDPAIEGDLKPAEAPTAPYAPIKVSATLVYGCDVGPAVTPPQPEKPKPAAPPQPPRFSRHGGRWAAAPVERATGMTPFRNLAAPALGADEIGFDNGPSYDIVQLRAYAWGKKGADWTRTGRWMVRFDDRFDQAGGIRSSATTASLWPDETLASDAIGNSSYGSTSWAAFLDPSGRALLGAGCRGSMCSFYSVAEGQPVLPVRDASGKAGMFHRPFAHGAVRVGEAWFFASQSSSYDAVALFRVDLGVARQIGSYYRPTTRYSSLDAPRMVRRAFGGGVGLLIAGQADPGQPSGLWYVLPINPETGELGEAVTLGRRDFGGVPPERCTPEQDGWVFDTTLDSSPVLEPIAARGTFEYVELRLRMDPGTICLEGMSARVQGSFTNEPPKPPPAAAKPAKPPPKPPAPAPLAPKPLPRIAPDDRVTIPLAATERYTGRRWSLQCKPKVPKK